MSKREQVKKSETPEADAEQNRMSEEAAAADAQGGHSNLDATPVVAAPSKFKMKRTKAVAVPLFKFEPNVPRYYLVDGVMFLGKKVDAKKDAATLLPVTDLETGEQGQVIVGQVLRELFNESYPDGVYVGKKFEMTLRKRADKKYNTYDLYEVEGEA
jgi:uncharacterized OB-fold protein